jgi:hypothetical protein
MSNEELGSDIRQLLGAVMKLSETQEHIIQVLKTIAAERANSLAVHNDHARAIKSITETQSKIATLVGELSNQHGQILKALNERISALEIKAVDQPPGDERLIN